LRALEGLATPDSTMKIKFGTQLEEDIYDRLKMTSAKERRPIGEIVQQALTDYMQKRSANRGGKSGLARLLESDPLQISPEQIRQSMEVDYWDQ